MSQTISYPKYYNYISPGYDELYEEEQLKKIEIVKKIIIDIIININKKNEINNKISNKINIDNYKILDVGCGTGISQVISENVVGIDPSIKLLKKAKIKRVNGVAESLPFKDNVFDVVMSVTAIHNFNNIKEAIKEMKRVAKSERSYFIISVLKKSKKFRLIKNMLNKNFKVKYTVEEDKDIIFFCDVLCKVSKYTLSPAEVQLRLG